VLTRATTGVAAAIASSTLPSSINARALTAA
jgi:hypothetical protein